jgi:hypothetical protein
MEQPNGEMNEPAPRWWLLRGCLLILAVVILTPVACAVVSLLPFVAVTVNVANVDPSETLRDLVISGCGEVRHVSRLAPERSLSTRIHGSGECSVALSFRTEGGQRREVPPQGYIEGDYIGVVAFKVDRTGLRHFESNVHPWWEPK